MSLGKAAGVEAILGPAVSLCSLVQAGAGLVGGTKLVLGIQAQEAEGAQGSYEHDVGKNG